ncbi:hypothetical protein Tco_1223062, partial [Tanacetum coccineum]
MSLRPHNHRHHTLLTASRLGCPSDPRRRHRSSPRKMLRFLALPTPPLSPLSPYSSPLPQIPSPPLPIPSPPPNSPTYIEAPHPSPVHETEIPKICLPLRKRLCRTAPTPRYEVRESLAAGAARQDRLAVARADLYGFVDMVDAAPGRLMSSEFGYGIMDTWDDLVGAILEIAPTTLGGQSETVRDYRVAGSGSREIGSDYGDAGSGTSKTDAAYRGTKTSEEVTCPDDRKMAPKRRTTRSTPVTDTLTTTSVTNAQLQAMIDQGVTAVLAARDATQNGDDSHTLGTDVRKNERVVRECTFQDFMKCQPLYFKS